MRATSAARFAPELAALNFVRNRCLPLVGWGKRAFLGATWNLYFIGLLCLLNPSVGCLARVYRKVYLGVRSSFQSTSASLP